MNRNLMIARNNDSLLLHIIYGPFNTTLKEWRKKLSKNKNHTCSCYNR